MLVINKSKRKYSQGELIKAQVRLEFEMKSVGIDRFNSNNQRAIDSGVESETAWNNKILMETTESLSLVIDAYLEYYTGRCGKPSASLKFLQLLPTRESALVTIRSVFDIMQKHDACITSIAERIGRKIEDQVRFSKLEKDAPAYIESIKESLNKAKSKSYGHKRRVLSSAGDKLAKQGQTVKWHKWIKVDCIQLGSLLIDMFQENVLFNGESLLDKEVIWNTEKKGKKITRLVFSDSALLWIEQFKDNVEALAPSYAPCVIRPRNWVYDEADEDQNGGYHVPEIAETLRMIRGRKSQRSRNTETQCPEVYKALNILQGTKQTVSTEVMIVAQHIMENKLPLAMPLFNPISQPISPVPDCYAELKGKELFSILTKKEQKAFQLWKQEATACFEAELQRKAELTKIGRILGEARKYNHFEALYYVYTLDFRDRVYSQGSLLSTQGQDLQKGLLRFSNGVALGSTGYKWLAFQGANVWGNDKISIDDRVKFTESMNETIKAIAKDPLSNKQWVNADKPWQFLNWAFEWASLLEWIEDGKNAEDFISFIPCANDGSCSGLQHYSAILRDPVGGASVNLVPSSLPKDIYGEVATVLESKLMSLAGDNTGSKESILARLWLIIDGGITRTLCKPPVMTTPYGSTQRACHKTTKEYLEDLQAKSNKKALANELEFVPVHPFGADIQDAISFLVPILWESIGEVVKAARVAMKFIKEVARKLSRAGHHMEWVSPCGFIVEQKIYDSSSRRVETQMFGRTIINVREPSNVINTRKMQTSSAPNFIHTMDASHLIKAVCSMADNGLTDIVVIHDSFGTHAGNTEVLRNCLLESFVNMYKENDVLEMLVEHNEDLFMTDLEMELPEMLGLDLDVILDSIYCFS